MLKKYFIEGKYIIPINKYYHAVLVSFVFMLVSFLSIVNSVQILLSDSNIFPPTFFVDVAVFLFFSNSFLWYLFGVETLCYSKETIIITKSNRLITIKRRIKISSYESASINPVESKIQNVVYFSSKFRAFPFWLQMGKVTINRNNKSFTAFNGLSDLECVALINEMDNKIFQLRKNVNHDS